eukprot:TRINITY_DN8365_c1_g1_i1.p2 TRINITY_DN8365_c1_g1~~TRINITY_DN8365_c1_g1_i1.p2  ORF type:complete len:236 (-),score=32.39 TRINITY_DN8365_c1_g1_i1:97-774(-)
MAPSPKHLSLLTLLFLISSLQVQARESKFFSHYNTAKEAKPLQTPAPSPTEEVDPYSYNQENQNGYGLYGRGTDQATPTTTTFNNVQYTAREPPTVFPTEEYAATTTEKRNYMNKEYTTKYPNNEYEKNQYGMSDTRYLDNGRYYYDLNANNNNYQFETGKGNTNNYQFETGKGSSQRYGSYGNKNQMNKYNTEGYYGNNESPSEYNTSVDSYRGSQEDEDNFLP